jgi:hypothetical protein
VPSLTTRRTETELELENNQTFAIAGLLNNTMNESLQRIPGIGDIPILGYLFRSKAAQKNQTELVVMITPEILPAKSPGVTPDLPRISEPYLPPLPENRLMNQPPPPFGALRPVGDPRMVSAPAVAAVAKPAGETAVQPAPSAASPASSGETAAQPGPVSAVAPEGAAPAVPALTPQEQRALDRAMREEERKAREAKERAEKEMREMQAQAEKDAAERQKVEERAQAEAARKLAEQELAAKREADREREQQERLAREQAKRDAEAARQAAREAERQAEADRRRQKAVEEAEARLKAAEAAYQAEVANADRGNP